MTVRTRFAPSPTGYMHIGGMRTALFNWLWAKQNGGQFVLRIDDTDAERNRDEALGPILDAFRWLGLDWDEGPEVGGDYGPYYQSERRSLHDEALKKLIDSKAAYYDFEAPEDTRAQREAAEKEKRNYISSRASLDFSDEEVQQKLNAGDAHVVRFLVPRDRTVSITDHVRGHVEWNCALMVDPVVARADGSPLYNFATAVDDGQLKISHVIRAEEHLSNTPIQVLIHEALGNDLPEFAHIPFVAAPGGKKKLSKRDIDEALSPVMVAYYRDVGFLPAGVLNALSRLGWSLDDETENMSLKTVQKNFSLDRVVKAAAGLDPDKLMSFQAHWMGELSTDEKVAASIPFLQKAGLIPEEAGEDIQNVVRQVIELTADRLRVFGDLVTMPEFFVTADQLEYSEKDFQKRIVASADSVNMLRELRTLLDGASEFKSDVLHDAVNGFVEQKELKFGQVGPALRIATTGKTKGADLFPTLEFLGKEETLARIDRTISLAESAQIA
ncbi:UNVERIFIED_CONTAM: hypothetical protein GTU68_050261 [Idotea baltica]|nr:hypothetical protein [Idotea baltica]